MAHMCSPRVLLLVLLSAGTARASSSLFSGSLTWAVHPNFTAGVRRVTFTLDSAFEMDLRSESNCSYPIGQRVSCNDPAKFGRLCVDQYRRAADNADPPGPGTLHALHTYTDEANCPGVNNRFQVRETRHVNGANLVFGRLVYEVTVDDTAFAVFAFLSTGRLPLVPEPGTDVGSAGVLLPQCRNLSNAAGNAVPDDLPCSVNTHDTRGNVSFGLFKKPDTKRSAELLSYYGTIGVTQSRIVCCASVLGPVWPLLSVTASLCAAACDVQAGAYAHARAHVFACILHPTRHTR